MVYKKTLKKRSKSLKRGSKSRSRSRNIKKGGFFIRDGSTQQFWGVNSIKKSRNNRNGNRNRNKNERRNRLSVTYNNGEFDFKYI